MKIDADLQDYINRTEQAINANPPYLWPAYTDDPVMCWRYVCRLFGYGLAEFDNKQVRDVVKGLYGRWFIRLELFHKLPEINNADFIGWIINAMEEANDDAKRREAQGRRQETIINEG